MNSPLENYNKKLEAEDHRQVHSILQVYHSFLFSGGFIRLMFTVMLIEHCILNIANR